MPHVVNVNLTENYLVKKIDRSLAKPFVETWHYTHSIGKVSEAYGLFNETNLEGVITYGQVSSRDLAQSLFVGGSQYNTWEFLRMAVLDCCICPRTWFISKTIKQIKINHPEIKCLVSFADQTEGHFGYVYQASNWLYTGQTGKKYHFIVNGKRINKRMAYDNAKKEGITEKEFVIKYQWEKVVELPKFRYIYPISKDINLKLSVLAYPKERNMLDRTSTI